MRIIVLVAATVLASPVSAQIGVYRGAAGAGSVPSFFRVGINDPKAVIGITTSGAATSRDTLGVLVSSVRSGSPAEKAGIEEGNRIASINGVSLKLAAADVGEFEMAGAMTRRLTRELNKLKPGDEVDLRVVANGQTKSLKIKTMAPEDLRESTIRRLDSERATLGINLAVTGSARDTLGVFVLSVEDGGPAAKAGIEEGARIASVNGADVRGKRSADDEDFMFRTSNVSRFERELAKVKPGEDVDLRVYYNGQFKNVKVKAGRWSDSPHRNRSITILGGDNFMVPPLPPFPDRLEIRDGELGNEIRRVIDGVRVGVGGAMGGMLPRVGNRIVW